MEAPQFDVAEQSGLVRPSAQPAYRFRSGKYRQRRWLRVFPIADHYLSLGYAPTQSHRSRQCLQPSRIKSLMLLRASRIWSFNISGPGTSVLARYSCSDSLVSHLICDAQVALAETTINNLTK